VIAGIMNRVEIDRWIMTLVAAHRDAALTEFSRALCEAGTNTGVLLLITVAVTATLAARRAWRLGITLAAALVAADLIAHLLKLLIERPRPAGELTLLPTLGGWAMPSTHAAITTALAGTVYLVTNWRSARLRRLAGAGLAAAVIVVAATMVYLGAHWPSDILAGWLIGGTTGAAASVASRRIPARHRVRPEKSAEIQSVSA
jgi:membrane-associated phospholipid phosphatase